MSEKHAGNGRCFEKLRRKAVLLILCFGSRVRLRLQNSESGQTLRLYPSVKHFEGSPSTVDFVCDILSQAGMIAPNEKRHWVSLNASTSSISIKGAVCLVPHANKSIQLLGIGINPVDGEERLSLLHDEVNHLFYCSEFGSENEERKLTENGVSHQAPDLSKTHDRLSRGELKGRKGVDRWPKYFLCVEISGKDFRDTEDLLERDRTLLSTITELLNAMITAFLTKYNFRPKAARSKKSTTNQSTEKSKMGNDDDAYKDDEDITDARNNNFLQRASATTLVSRDVEHLPFEMGEDSTGTGTAIQSLQTLVSLPKVRSSLSSRIRKGSRVAIKLNSSTSQHQQHRSQSEPPPSTQKRLVDHASSNYFPVVKKKTQLLLKSGQLGRIPFEDVENSTPHVLMDLSSRSPEAYKGAAEIRLWTDPFTKSRSIIDLRTGRTISQKEQEISYSKPSVSTFDTDARPSSAPGSLAKPQLKGRDQNTWLSSVLQNWENPVFAPTESKIPQVCFGGVGEATQDLWHGSHSSCSEIELDRAFRDSSDTIECCVSKDTLRGANVIAQVDNKFVLIKTSRLARKGNSENMQVEGERLLLIDQHAADERIRLEELMQSFFQRGEDGLGVATSLLDKPIKIELSREELGLLCLFKSHFTFWGIFYQSADERPAPATMNLHGPQRLAGWDYILINSLPATIQERCKQEPRLLLQLIRSELWRMHESGGGPPLLDSRPLGGRSWVELISKCPRGIVDLLNSRACRSAIMFNDQLTKSQCERLVRGLSECMFPFQCAHGRPSLVPLVDLARLSHPSGQWSDGGREADFATSFQAWTQDARESS
jgi:DNA mismatch repair protein MLH3